MIQEYINFIISQIIKDSELLQLDGDHFWNFFLIPLAWIFILLIIKYSILTLPIWLPANLIINSIVNFTKNILNKK